MKTDRKSNLIILFVIFFLLVLGCGKLSNKKEGIKTKEKEEVSNIFYIKEFRYSNLNSEKSSQEIRTIMKDAGINSKYIDVFMEHVIQFNSIIDEENDLIGDFLNTYKLSSDYDSYKLQKLWERKYPNFIGYNCRITSFGLFKDYLKVNISTVKRDKLLFMDLEALEADSSVISNSQEMEKFKIVYSLIPTENTKNFYIHVKNIKSDFEKRGIEFIDNPNVRMINVFFHDNIDIKNSFLFIAHTGILLKNKEGRLYFIEKIAFQEPYQVSIFENRRELNDFLMKRYDIEKNQDHAKPIIFENGELMEGYRFNPDND